MGIISIVGYLVALINCNECSETAIPIMHHDGFEICSSSEVHVRIS